MKLVYLCSLVFGNLYVYIAFDGVSEVDHDTRTRLIAILLSVCVVGTALLLAIRSVTPEYDRLNEADSANVNTELS